MPSFYPGGLDSLNTSHQDNVNEIIHASDIDDLADAINKIEAALGINPQQGLYSTNTFASLVARLNAIDAPSHKTITAPYTCIQSDLSAILFTLNTTSGQVITLPANASVPLPHGATLTFSQGSTGTFTVSGATGVSVVSRGSIFTSAGQYAMVTAIKTGADFWIVSGDVA